MKVVKGDLLQLALQGQFDVIVHGCNCQCAMGAGIAKAIRKLFPEAYEADCRTFKGYVGKLGTFSRAKIVRDGVSFYVVNAYTQEKYGLTGVNVDYRAIATAMRNVKGFYPGKRIGYPKIGAGLGGGDWEIIEQIIDHELEGEDHTLVVLE